MKFAFRLFVSMCLLGSFTSGVSPANAQYVTADACTEIFSVSATDLSGTAVSGEIQDVEVAAMQDGWQQWYAVDHTSPSAGVFHACALTGPQLDKAQVDYGDEFDSKFESGDQLLVTFLPQGSSVTQVYRHVLTEAQAVAANAKTISSLPNLIVSASTQVPVAIKDSTGVLQANAPFEIWEVIKKVENGSSWNDYQYITAGTTDSSGTVQVAGISNGSYELHAFPGESPSANSMRTKASFTVSGGVATFDSTSVVSGVLTLSDANVKFRVVDENSNPFAQEILNEMFPSLNSDEYDWDTISRRSDGYFMASLPDEGSYDFNVNVGGETGYVRTEFTIEIASGITTFKKDSVALPSNSLNIDKGNVGFKALDFYGQVVPQASISVFSAATCTTETSIRGFSECDQNVKYLDISGNGLGTAKLSDGTYWVYMDPWSAGFDSKASLSKFTISSGIISSPSGFAVRSAAGSPTSFLGLETVVLSARKANFTANITTQSGAAITGGWTYSEPNCSMNMSCNWRETERSSGDIDTSGRIGLFLPAAPSGATKTYKVQVEPSSRFSSESARVNFLATVNDAGEVTNVTPPSQLPNNVVSPTNGLWTLRLPSPNLSGTVLMPTGSTAVPYANFSIQKWDNGGYFYSPDIPWMFANEKAQFSGYFTPGRYLVTVNPPYDLTNVADKDYEIVIATNGDACLYDGTNASTCASPIAPGSFNLRLASPNVMGTVTKGGVALTRSVSENASVELLKWDTKFNYWNSNRWSQVSGDGSYSFNVQSAGVYQITVNPGFVEGYSSGREFLVVGEGQSGLTFCKIPEPGLDTLSRATCGGNATTLGSVVADIALQRANLQINVSVPEEFEGWVNASLYKLYELPAAQLQGNIGFEGNYMYAGYMDLRQDGNSKTYSGFNSLTDNNNNPAKYRIEFYSDASNEALPLAHQKKFLWAYNFDTSDSEIELCPEASYNKVDQTCVSQELLDSSRPLNVELNSGNLSGAVKTPTGGSVPYASLQIQKWEKTYWSGSNFNWNWTDLYANSNKDGSFALNIENPGFYKIVARQNYGDTLPFADSVSVVKVGENGNWCVLSGEIASYGTSTAPVAETACTLGRDNAPNDQVSGLTLQLKNPKITGTLRLVSGEPAVNSYVWIRKWNPTNRFYEHIDYANTNSDGKFFINPPDGDYQLEFYPGWENRITEIGYEKNLCVGANAPTGSRPASPENCAATYDLNEQFLGPNLKGIVCPAGSTANTCTEGGVRHSWIEVREKGSSGSNDPNNWSWTKGTSTDSDGRYALRLAEGTDANPKLYSLRIYPNDWWAEDQGVGKRVIVSVGNSVCKMGDSIAALQTVLCNETRIGLLSPNVSGTLTYNNTDQSPISDQQLMKYSWVSIYSENYSTYIAGANTNSVGRFATTLEPGTYFLDAYSNSAVATRSSLRLTIKVTSVPGGTSVTWKYRNQDNNSFVSTPIVADFDFVPPNVKINLSAQMTKSHIVLIKDLDPDPSTREQPRRFVSNGTLASGVLTKGKSYSVKIVPNYEEVLTGICEFSPAVVTFAEGETINGIVQANTFSDLTSCRPQ